MQITTVSAKKKTEAFRKLNNKKLHNSYSLNNPVKVFFLKEDEVDETFSTYMADEKSIQNSGQKTRRKRPLWRPRRRWENKITMDLREMGCEATELNRSE